MESGLAVVQVRLTHKVEGTMLSAGFYHSTSRETSVGRAPDLGSIKKYCRRKCNRIDDILKFDLLSTNDEPPFLTLLLTILGDEPRQHSN